ncbi:nuclear transport factor 2 family protein [Pendulispora albinea]|uniref:Nuclear transport factor 2 family protein n=1 Tax=Pendulispora albinea TaxID=2741071 RepID=A0ABZ2LRV5_9BACT
MSHDVSEVVRKIFDVYRTGDEEALDDLLSDDFRFTSPRDDRIDKATYFERCWSNRDKIRSHRIENLVVDGSAAFVRYQCELTTGAKFHNTEYIRVEDGRIKEVEVYFGASL